MTDDPEAVQQETMERLLPAMEDLAEAVCRGDRAALQGQRRRLAHLVGTCPDPLLAKDFVALVVLLVSELWDEDRASGVTAPRPPLLTMQESLAAVQELLSQMGATRGVAEALMARANEAGNRGDERARQAFLTQARDALAELGDDDALRMRAFADGLLEKSMARPDAAVTAFREAARRSAELQLPASEALSLAELAGMLTALGRHEDAAAAYDRAARLARTAELDDRTGLWMLCAADARVGAGRDAVTRHRFGEASELFAAARAGYRTAGPDQAGPAANAALHRGIAEFSRADREAARHWFRIAEAEYEALGDAEGLGNVHFAWGSEALSRGDAQAAERMLRSAHGELTSAGQTRAAGGCLRLLGACAIQRGYLVAGQALLEEAARILGGDESRTAADFGWILSVPRPSALEPAASAAHEVRLPVEPTIAPDDDMPTAAELRRMLGPEPSRLAAATLAEANMLLEGDRLQEAEALVAEMDALVERAVTAPESHYQVPMLSWLPALARGAVALRVDSRLRSAEEHLAECHRRMLATGSLLPAARVAVVLARLAADRGRPDAAIDRVVPALLGLRSLAHDLPDAGERRIWQAATADAAQVALSAAARHGDPRLVAELLETLRANAMPELVARTDAATGSLAELLADVSASATAVGERRRTSGSDSAVRLARPPAVLMPWGRRPALERHLDPALAYGGVQSSGAVPLQVPR
ncbi:MAG: hypothetical protein JNL54_04205 [Kineosporiaceae bacterium]|nr:hypothetical protein [Kineosporiaceae bacterium]